MPRTGDNAQQAEYWNGEAGAKWVALQERLDAQIGPLGQRALDAARLAAGDRVLDVGCGCGSTSLDLARRVGGGGSVTGVDLSQPMLARARERARLAGADRISFHAADAQVFPFEPGSFDVVTSRFGVMFFADPTAAFSNLCRALVPGGRLSFVCWQPLDRNPWMLVPLQAAAPHLELPPPPEAGAPGPFAFGDPARVLQILEGAGFVRASLTPVEDVLSVGGEGSLDEIVEFTMMIGPTGRLLAGADAALRARVHSAIRDALAPYTDARGVRMNCAAWIASAWRPGS